MESDILVAYYKWLCELAESMLPKRKYRYTYVLEGLAAWEFYSDIPGDENRETDAVQLRKIFAEKTGAAPVDCIDTYIDETASVLEVLISLAYRADSLVGETGEPHPEIWFQIMFKNLGLLEMDDSHCDDTEFFKRIMIFLNHGYNSDGSNGGLFVLKSPRKDLRKTELWYQMNWYLSEMYGY